MTGVRVRMWTREPLWNLPLIALGLAGSRRREVVRLVPIRGRPSHADMIWGPMRSARYRRAVRLMAERGA